MNNLPSRRNRRPSFAYWTWRTSTHSAKKERAIYEENLKNYRDWYATIDYAQTEGIEKGMQKGIEKGRQEEKLQIAQKMKEQGLDSELIAQCSGLSVEDIERL